MRTIKEYAKTKGVTPQAVYKQLKTHKKELEGHIQKIKGISYLDDWAIDYLNVQTETAPSVVVSENKDLIIEELKKNIELLLTEKSQLESKLTAVSEWKAEKAVMIAKAEQQQLLLEQKDKQIKETAEEHAQIVSDMKAQLNEESKLKEAAKAEADHLHLQNQELEQRLEVEKNRKLTFKERLIGKKYSKSDVKGE